MSSLVDFCNYVKSGDEATNPSNPPMFTLSVTAPPRKPLVMMIMMMFVMGMMVIMTILVMMITRKDYDLFAVEMIK